MEQVLVVPNEYVKAVKFVDGFCSDLFAVHDFLNSIKGKTLFMDREKAENDPSYQQLIPYVVIWSGREIFRYQRTKKGGESRLHDLVSIGVGGHINPDDDGATNYHAALWRELTEEVGLSPHIALSNECVGLIYDTTNEVGRVHLGVVHFVRVPNDVKLTMSDPALQNGYFQHVLELVNTSDPLENWSKLVIKNLL